MYYKAESYIGSEYAGKILYDEGLTPVYVSDNPVLNAQHVLFEAAKGYKFGLPYHAALASVTSAPAELLGLGNRLGKVKPGYDADIVVWDSDPLSVGATPVQVWIDGTAQFDNPYELVKPQRAPMTPDPSLQQAAAAASSFDDNEDKDEATAQVESVIFTGVAKVLLPVGDKRTRDAAAPFNVVVHNGTVACVGTCAADLGAAAAQGTQTIHLKNGYLVPAFTALGATLGLNEIDAEASTDDGDNSNVFSRAVDGLALATKKLAVAHAYGVTRAITAPKFAGGGDSSRQGLSVGFATGARSRYQDGAVWADEVSVHYTLNLKAKREPTPSISSAVGALRQKLLAAVAATTSKTEAEEADPYAEAAYLRRVVQGDLPLVLTVHSADTIAAILDVKATVESALAATATATGRAQKLRLVLLGGAEAYLLAAELAAADVGVVLAPAQSYRESWDQRRALTGAPLTNGTSIDRLVAAGVTTAIGLEEDWRVRDLALLAGVAYQNGGGLLSEKTALDLVSTNVYKVLGLEAPEQEEEAGHFVVYEGSPLEIGSRIRAVAGGLGKVSVF